MSSITQDEIKNESKFMSMLWQTIKEYYTPEDGDKFWQDVADRLNGIDKACDSSRLGEHLMWGFMEYLEEKQKGERMPHNPLKGGNNETQMAYQAWGHFPDD